MTIEPRIKINGRNISVVVQGPIHHKDGLTKRVLESAREHLPEAELILSTWKGSDVSDLCFDILVENDDPGSINGNNVNRQIVSTRSGLGRATRLYAVKMRTDTIMTGLEFTEAFELFPERRDDFKIFQRKIVIPNLYTRNPRRLYLFHPSDIFQFGLTSDILNLWSIDLYCPQNDVHPAFKSTTEQHIWLSCLRKNGYPILYDLRSLCAKLAFLSEISIFNNFIVQDSEEMGIKLPGKFAGFSGPHLCYSGSEVNFAYSHYCEKKSSGLTIRDFLYFSFKFAITKLSLSMPKTSKFLSEIGIREAYYKALGISE